jgi:microcystin degradation protein MlrC
MKLFIAGLTHETSAFSPIPTNRASFDEIIAYRPRNGVLDAQGFSLNGYGAFAKAAREDGIEVVGSSYYWAQPSNRCTRVDYELMRDEILADLRQEPSISMVLLFLHGAQMADGYDDCEGDLLAGIRAIVGPDVFVGALLDLHANVTQLMLDKADALVACRLYPHSDFDERAVELYKLGLDAARRQVSPVSHYERLPMLGMFYTTEPLMALAVAAARELELRPGILSVSLIHGFLWADIAEMGPGVLIVSDGERPEAKAEARELGRMFFAARNESKSLRMTIDSALDHIEDAKTDVARRPFLLADCSDNAGGGAGSDSTFILEQILARCLTGYVVGLLWDPLAAQFAAAAGEGARLAMRIGGKTGPRAGNPIDAEVRVLRIGRDMRQFGLGFEARTGLNAMLEVAGNLVVVNDIRGQVFSPTCFTELGINFADWKAFVVKSTQHFRDQFAPLAREVLYCETPGSLSLALDPSLFQNLNRPVWPFDDVTY